MPILAHPILGRISFPDNTPLDAMKTAVEQHLANNSSSQIAPGNIDLYNRPHVKNADGSISTVRSIGVNIGGQEILLPTVSDDGRIMSNQEAIDTYRKTGRHLGKFADVASSNAYASQLHNDYAAGKYDALPQITPEQKGGLASFAQALGLPTSLPEAQAVNDENNLIQHPSNLLGPMTPMIRGFAQNASTRLQNAYHESLDAGQNIGNGQPVAQNVGKAGLSGLQAMFSMIPLVGENANTLGMQVARGNNSGATGTMAGTLLPFALGALGEKPSISPKTLQSPVAPSELRPFEGAFKTQADVPQAIREHVSNGGGEYKGAMEGTNLVFFNDPQTHSTLALPSYLINGPEDVAKHMRMSRLEFAKGASAGSK